MRGRELIVSLVAVAAVMVAVSGLSACSADLPSAKATTRRPRAAATASPSGLPLRGASAPTEHVGFTAQLPVDRARFDAVASGLFGADAAAGAFVDDVAIGAGLHLASSAHPTSSSQVALTVTLDSTGAKPPTRVVARAPASLAEGATFISTVDAALAQAESMRIDDPGGRSPFRLEYRSRSAQGGSVTLAVVFDPATGVALELQAQGPTTSLAPGQVNRAATEGRPYETIYGLVWFGLTRDQFDFFANRAYGISAGKSQNFKDFELVPHNWLRLTVTPELDDDRVVVGFEVVTLDGRRIPVAKAPASLTAGEEFMQTVFRMAENTSAQEQAAPGSSTPWEVPFYYDDPDGGGVVEVIAKGAGGETQIAYSVESPAHELSDLPFVAFQGRVDVPEDWDKPVPTCQDLGSKPATTGKFLIRYDPSSTVRGTDLKAPLKGRVWGSVYRAQDVKITGPLDGTSPVASIALDAIDTTAGPTDPILLDTELPAGQYQILGFMDIDANADLADPGPDEGDPVMIPIGGFDLACAVQPVTAQFAIVLPPGV